MTAFRELVWCGTIAPGAWEFDRTASSDPPAQGVRASNQAATSVIIKAGPVALINGGIS